MSDNIPERKKIHELPKQMADKIAAGEVVDRPVSIVKELVENSIDAGASSIAVEIKNGGKTYIRVTDNGCGIASDETELAFKRHATSKLSTVRDLNAISTLGFRGEALASISAVSRVELITKTADAETGTSLRIEGGETSSAEPTGCPQGTTIIVKDLFFNTPARMKFLKKDNTESALIIDFISKMALAYPDIRVRLINNGNTLFATQGRGDMFNTIATIYDPAMAKKLIHFKEGTENGITVNGYISSPDETRANRKNQIFFVNGRYIQSKLLEKCVSDGYREKVFEGRYPVVFLFIKLPPEQTDVNIHPNKKEIRFDDENIIREFVTQAIRSALTVPEAVPEFTFKKEKERMGAAVREKQQLSAGRAPGAKNDVTGVKTKQQQLDIKNILRQKRAEEEAASYSTGISQSSGSYAVNAGKPPQKPEGPSPVRDKHQADTRAAANTTNAAARITAANTPAERPTENSVPPAPAADASTRTPPAATKQQLFAPHTEPAPRRPFDISAIRPIGSVFAEFILGCDDDSFYMIDQHAAHERVFYEKLTREFYGQQTASQIMALPIQINVSPAVKNAEDDWLPFLRGAGFSVEEFGPRAYAVKEIPAYMTAQESESFIKDFCDSLDEPGAFRDKRRADKIITRACKSAVKANDRLDTAEINQLLKDLAQCDNPFSCPHGRPTVIRMKKTEIEALFKR